MVRPAHRNAKLPVLGWVFERRRYLKTIDADKVQPPPGPPRGRLEGGTGFQPVPGSMPVRAVPCQGNFSPGAGIGQCHWEDALV